MQLLSQLINTFLPDGKWSRKECFDVYILHSGRLDWIIEVANHDEFWSSTNKIAFASNYLMSSAIKRESL